ncbi:unnamed protein product [Brassica oleracea]
MIVEFVMYTSISRLLYLVSSNRDSNWHELSRRVLVVAKNSLALRQQSTLDNANPKQLWISGLLLLLLVYVMEQAFLHSGFLFIWFGCKDSTCPANLCRELCRGKPGSSSREGTQEGTQGIFT